MSADSARYEGAGDSTYSKEVVHEVESRTAKVAQVKSTCFNNMKPQRELLERLSRMSMEIRHFESAFPSRNAQVFRIARMYTLRLQHSHAFCITVSSLRPHKYTL
jgi:hypothetical protein